MLKLCGTETAVGSTTAPHIVAAFAGKYQVHTVGRAIALAEDTTIYS
jgi:hypothetical protein